MYAIVTFNNQVINSLDRTKAPDTDKDMLTQVIQLGGFFAPMDPDVYIVPEFVHQKPTAYKLFFFYPPRQIVPLLCMQQIVQTQRLFFEGMDFVVQNKQLCVELRLRSTVLAFEKRHLRMLVMDMEGPCTNANAASGYFVRREGVTPKGQVARRPRGSAASWSRTGAPAPQTPGGSDDVVQLFFNGTRIDTVHDVTGVGLKDAEMLVGIIQQGASFSAVAVDVWIVPEYVDLVPAAYKLSFFYPNMQKIPYEDLEPMTRTQFGRFLCGELELDDDGRICVRISVNAPNSKCRRLYTITTEIEVITDRTSMAGIGGRFPVVSASSGLLTFPNSEPAAKRSKKHK